MEEKKKLEVENNNDLRGMGIVELAAPVIHMRGVADKMKEAFLDMKDFISEQKANINNMSRMMYEAQAAEEDEEFERENRQNEIRQQRQAELDEIEDEEQRQAGEFEYDSD